MKRGLLAACTALALSGCVMGPNYRAPQPVSAKLSQAEGMTAQAPLPPRWWHLYDDPVLDRLEEQALNANTELRVAAASLSRARAMTEAAEGANEPEFSVDAAAQRARLSAQSYLQSETLPVMNLGAAGGSMSYQFDLFGRLRRGAEAARADEQSVGALADAVKVTLAAEVAKSYVEVCGAQEMEAIVEHSVEVQERLVEFAERLQAEGRGSAIEVSAAKARLADAKAALPLDRIKSRAALYRLAFLMGRTPDDYPREAEACHHLPKLSQPLPTGDGAALIARRPDIRAAERQLAAATARIGVATAELYPQIGIGLTGGTTGLLADLGQAATNRWSIAGLIRWNFPSAGPRAKVRAAKADTARALAVFDGKVLNALREVQTAISTYGENHNRLLSLTEARVAADETADQLRRLREGGKAAAQVDIGGRNTALLAAQREQAAKEALVLDQINLFLALGGGW